MIVVLRKEPSEKIVFGRHIITIPFIGINDAGGLHRIGIGLMSDDHKPEITLAFASGVQNSIIFAARAVKILAEVRWVHGQTLRDCLLAADDTQSSEIFEELGESLCLGSEGVEALREKFRMVTVSELSPILEITKEYRLLPR